MLVAKDYFLVLGWICSKHHSRLLVDQMQIMVKLHTYYVKFSEAKINDQEKEYDQTNEGDDLDQDNKETFVRNNKIMLDKYFNINVKLQKH
ncbi:hypothetical protein RCL_jg23375.t1 [Rhizophagus clarus]|uniref:Uncharacterized protein n=1 Tax=Rhizophagus clarus TaxID=94130 RepID=A0A8H3QG57_9GLOM|nr:hypothetical protein RCL_jg23375.t1 [Rhizophagus clarus]